MAFDRFLIAPFTTGWQNDLKAWLVPEDAFTLLNNAYVFRGRVRKRFGSDYMVPAGSPNQSRLRVQVETTNGSGNASGTVPGNKFLVGQAFSVGTNVFTVNVPGTPGTMLTTGPGTGTFNTSTGAFIINGAPATMPVFWYPAQPVMGITNYEVGPINNQPTFAFDTQFAYRFIPGSGWVRSQSGGVPVFHGNNLNFFWSTNWQGAASNITQLFVTNFNVANPNGVPAATDDPIWAFDGTNWGIFSTTTVFNTQGGATKYVQSCRLIVVFYNRLILLNTIETTDAIPTSYTAHPGRARFSFNGSPFAANAWLEKDQIAFGLKGAGAGFVDASTEEQIITAEFIKDRLIVFFERSTWELAYTGNEIQPFRWQKINTELGSESQNSAVPFDKQILAIGNVGVHACNGANVERIDNKIPDQIFDIIDKNTGPQRVAGIRDYLVECVYWAFPSVVNDQQDEESNVTAYPNQVLLYNYRNQTWAFNNDCITAFGYFEQQLDETWANNDDEWQEATYTWSDTGAVIQAQFRQIAAGNQQGFTFLVLPERARNAGVMQITNLSYDAVNHTATLIIIDHTLEVGEFIALENMGTFSAPNIIYQITETPDQNTVVIADRNTPLPFMSGTYVGGGTVARVSNLYILSKQWNPYNSPAKQDARDFYLHKIDFGVLKTEAGEVFIDYFPSAAAVSMPQTGGQTGALMGTSILEMFPDQSGLYPLEKYQERLWHPVYFQTDGTCIQILITQNYDQITTPAITWSDFQLEGITLFTQPTRSRLE